MNALWAIVLGILQGLTEFIPVSSSGHLVLAQSLIPGFSQPGILFDVVLHLGTLFAVFYFFRKTILRLGRKYYLLLIVGSIPAALIGFLFQEQLVSTFGNVKMVGLELIITGVLNLLIDRFEANKQKISFLDSFLVGISQAIAIIPGISRSGATIFSAVKLGIDKKKAAEFSFLLSIPAIAGANILQFLSNDVSSLENPLNYVIGFAAAFVTGFWSINLVLKSLAKRKFSVFGVYSIVLGSIVLL